MRESCLMQIETRLVAQYGGAAWSIPNARIQWLSNGRRWYRGQGITQHFPRCPFATCHWRTFRPRQLTSSQCPKWAVRPTGCATRLRKSLAEERKRTLTLFFRTAKGRKDPTRSLIQRERRRNAGISVATDRNVNSPKLDRKLFTGCGMSAEKHLYFAAISLLS